MEAWGVVSALRSVFWTDGQVDGGGAERGSLHVRVAPVPQRPVCLLDDLGRRPPQDIVGAARLVVSPCGKTAVCPPKGTTALRRREKERGGADGMNGAASSQASPYTAAGAPRAPQGRGHSAGGRRGQEPASGQDAQAPQAPAQPLQGVAETGKHCGGHWTGS